jgi:hypothetical protein
MSKLKRNPVVSRLAAVAAAVALAVLAQTAPSLLAQNGTVLQGGAQQNSGTATGDIYESGSQASDSCSQQNTSPFAAMDPLSCHGVMGPVDSAGQCSLQGMQLLQQVGGSCYYCQALEPPINGVIVPMNQLNQARAQGYKCGVDQANPNCMAICVQQGGMQQSPTPQIPGDVFSSGGGQASDNCSQQNTSPYAGMDPLSCYGVMAPVDSAGQCSLPRMQLLKQVGRTCYYCQAKNPPTNGIIVPISQLRQASAQGYKCGVDQADPQCMAICVDQGTSNFEAPPRTTAAPAPSRGPTACYGPAPPGVVGPGPKTTINLMELWTERIDTFWFKQFVTNNFVYTRPLLFRTREPGMLRYVPLDRGMYQPRILYHGQVVSDIVADTGVFGLVIALAHEEGHSVQYERRNRSRGLERELDADRLAGVYLRYAEDNNYLHECDIGAAALAIFRSADIFVGGKNLPPFDPTTHGTPIQRVQALMQGYWHGPDPKDIP